MSSINQRVFFPANFPPPRAFSLSALEWTSGGPVFHLRSGGEEGSFWIYSLLGRGSGLWDPATPRPWASRRFPVCHSSFRTRQTGSFPLRLPLAVELKHVKVAGTSTRGASLPSCGVVGTYYDNARSRFAAAFCISALAARRNCCLAWHRQQCPWTTCASPERNFLPEPL
jgi:hypothetical protein